MAGARNVHRAPGLSGPQLRHPYPTRTVLVVLAFAVPMKLHLHAPELVGVSATDPGYASTLIGMTRSLRIRAAIATQPPPEKIA